MAQSFGEADLASVPGHDFRCHALGRVNVWMPIVDSVRPMPEFFIPDHGNRGLTRSQQFQ